MRIALMKGHDVISSGGNMAADGMDQPIWSEEALQRVEHAPPFVRPGVYKLMTKRAREQGRSVITSAFLTEVRNESMLRVATCIRGFGFEELTVDAFEVAKQKMRRQPHKLQVIDEILILLAGRQDKNREIVAKFEAYLKALPESGLPSLPFTLLWSAEAEARVRRIPIPFMRGRVIGWVEAYAAARGVAAVDLTTYEAAISKTDRS